MADFIAEGLHEGYWGLTTAIIAATCGHDMEVPEITLNCGDSVPLRFTSVSLTFQAATLSASGAAKLENKRTI